MIEQMVREYEETIRDPDLGSVSCVVLRAARGVSAELDAIDSDPIPIPGSPVRGLLYQEQRRGDRNELPPGAITRQVIVFAVPRAVGILKNDIVILPAGRGTTDQKRGIVIEVQDNQLGWDVRIEVGAEG